MATVTAFIRVSTKKSSDVNVRFRLRDGRTMQLFYKSEITVKSSDWDSSTQAIKAKVLFDNQKRAEFNKSINELKALIVELYNAQSIKDTLTSKWLEDAIDRKLNPIKYKSEEPEDTEVFFLPRNNEEGGAFDPNASVGTRTIYREETDSIVTFKDNSYIAEYDIQSGEEIYSAKTDYPRRKIPVVSRSFFRGV